ncbi:hypothetical protein DUNSADRAFT_13170 [Dunaliella salina]|uniref:Uncharacterized protein n=1 Tax=Dunaliella salina TaxID=3046 RepID=A0ABQ7G9X9_DUNSA|nr:hypothetical protein DUNSADRAFT_13170 [Dunaliella salina]|eukprot:KAF5831409.1 hypothetical protein DUNSADRAFT_13170 [Dunaliella salina]
MQAYHDYISAIKYERAPQLEVNLPAHVMATGRSLQPLQGALGAGPDAPKQGAGDGHVPRQASDQQGGDAASMRDQGQVATSHAAGTVTASAEGVGGGVRSGVWGVGGHGNGSKSGPAVEPAVARTSVSVHIAFFRRLLAHSDTGAVMLVCGEGEGGAGQHCLASSLAGLLSGGLGGPKPAVLPLTAGSWGAEGEGASGPALQLDGGLFGQGHGQAGGVVADGGTSGVAGLADPTHGLPGHGTEEMEGVGPEGEQLYFVSDPQLRRARALFPCVDDAGRLAEYELWLSVPPDYVAVCGGELRDSTLTLAKEDSEVPQARTFHFAPGYPVTAAHMVIAAGPMDVQSGYQPAPPPPEGTRFTMNGGGGAEFGSAMRSVLNEVAKEGSAAGAGPATMHTKMYASAASNVPAPPPACAFTLFAPPALADLAAYTARPLYLIQREMEAHLDCPLPCSQLHVVFMPPAAMQALACGPQQAVSVGANIILPCKHLRVLAQQAVSVGASIILVGARLRCTCSCASC